MIVLDQIIQSPIKFKQIIGRGTRIDEDYGKMFFTIMDFKKATELFADPDFDGDPVQIYQPKPVDPIVPPDAGDDEVVIDDGEISRKQTRDRYVIADEEVSVAFIREQYYGKDGKLITESIKDYTRKTVSQEYASLDAFLKKWNSTEQKQAII
nr:hypothetical protein [Nostoc sp. NMS7]